MNNGIFAHRRARAAIATATVTLLFSAMGTSHPVVASSDDHSGDASTIQKPAEALSEANRLYAEYFGVSLAEAEQHRILREQLTPVIEELQLTHSQVYAGQKLCAKEGTNFAST